MDRFISAAALEARLGKELDALTETEDALYVAKDGRVVAVALDSERYARLLERVDHLEDSLAARMARGERDSSVSWRDLREPRS